MKKIATHNSMTGERGNGFLSWLVAPFSKCQSKTLEEQYEAGCRYYDIRVFRDKNGDWRCGHGLWTAERMLWEVICGFISCHHSDIFFSLTIEKGGDEELIRLTDFLDKYEPSWLKNLTYIAVKHPQWHIVKQYKEVPLIGEYMNLDGSSWHTYLPIPWLWKKLFYNKPKINDAYYVMVDFL